MSRLCKLFNTYFFFNLSSLSLGNTNDAQSLSQRLGIGGYYQCNKLSYIITPSEFITKIEALFMTGNKLQATGDSAVPQPEAPPEVETPGIGDMIGGASSDAATSFNQQF